MAGRRDDRRSPEAAAYRKLYRTARWQHLRLDQLRREPLCEMCRDQGRTVAAEVVNHRRPHRGDLGLFFDPCNIQSLCAPCHDGPVQSTERTGIVKGCDAAGRPSDPAHPWNRRD